MPDLLDSSRWLVALGIDEKFSNGRNKYRTCVLPSKADSITETLTKCLGRLMRGKSLPESVNPRDVAGWAFAAPLHNLSESIALSCLERVLRSRGAHMSLVIRNTKSKTSGLIFSDRSVTNVTTGNAPATTKGRDLCTGHLEKWKEILHLGHGVEVEIRDLLLEPESTEVIAASESEVEEIECDAEHPSVATEPIDLTADEDVNLPLAHHNNKPDAVNLIRPIVDVNKAGEESQGDVDTDTDDSGNSDDDDTDDADNSDDDEALAQHAQQEEARKWSLDNRRLTRGQISIDDSLPAEYLNAPRRSVRVAILDSIPKPEFPTPDPQPPRRKRRLSTHSNSSRHHKKFRGTNPGNLVFPPSGQNFPEGPFEVVCGTASGLWDPHHPLEIQYKDPSLPKNRPTRVVSGTHFEKLGGRGASKKWHCSVKVVLPGVTPNRSVGRVALALGMPIEKKPRISAAAMKIEECNGQEEYYQKVRENKCTLILQKAMAAGYTAANIKKRLASERTFRAKHRPDEPGHVDWSLLLPGGIWVRSIDDILRNPMRTDCNEDDVILTDDDREDEICTTNPQCLRTNGHDGGCIGYRGRIRRQKIPKKPGTATTGGRWGNRIPDFKKEAWVREDYLEGQWDEGNEVQQESRRERWVKRQGIFSAPKIEDVGIKHEEENRDTRGGVVPREVTVSEEVSFSSIALGFSEDSEDDANRGDSDKSNSSDDD